MWDDFKHNLTYYGLWLTGRGAVALSMIAAVSLQWLSPVTAPIIAVVAGLGIGSYLSVREANYQKQRMTNAYRNEIASALGIEPKEVTIDALELVAEGSKWRGIPANRVLNEQWDRINNKRNLSIASHLIGSLTAGIAVLTLFSGVLEPFLHWGAAAVGNAAGDLVSNPMRVAASLVAGAISFSADNLVNFGVQQMFGMNKPTLYDHIQDIKRQVRRGIPLTEIDTLALFVHADESLGEEVHKRFHKDFDKLDPRQQQFILDVVSPVYNIPELTNALNTKRIHGNELTFILDGRRSGVRENCGTSRCDERTVEDVLRGTKRDHQPRVDKVTTAAVSMNPPAKDREVTFLDALENRDIRSFVERFAEHRPQGNFQDRLASEATPGLDRVH